MYTPFKIVLLRSLRLPERPPDPPDGGYLMMQVFRASPRWLTYRLVLWWIGAGLTGVALLAALAGMIATGQPAGAVVVALVIVADAVLMGCLWFCVRIDYDMRTYVVTDRSLRVRQGAWTFKEMTLTYANVQNVQVLQGPLQRLFGIQDLRVDTAGGGGGRHDQGAIGHDVTLAGLENAREVRDLILSYVKVVGRGSGLGDLDDPELARTPPAAALSASGAVIDALRDVRGAAQALRQSAERRTRPI